MFFLDQAWLVPLIPALSFVVILLFGKRMPRQGSEVGVAAVGASFVLACGALVRWIMRVQDAKGGTALGALGRSIGHLGAEGEEAPVLPVLHHVTWFQNGGVRLTAGIQIDGLAVMMMFVVTLISLLVHVYSLEYMRGDRRYTYFYAALSLFTASMLLLVGWELVGVCSFMLIGHWWEEKPNSDAALKAFLTTRTGDIGLLTGVIMTFFVVQRATGVGSFDIIELNSSVSGAAGDKVGHTLILWTAAALMLAIVGKSGQFPLHTWLPDAMAGPTPVSALIHAATMVVAGVYLGARVYPVFYEGFSIGHGGVNLMAAIGGTTVIIGAALAFVQDDIKKVLAYSTISQLGYMVMGLGVGAWVGAVFHLFTHAFFKALLFLGAGSVSHSGSHHSFDMKKDMGGLRKFMPVTFVTFMIGSLALAGIFPLAGFWSKDEILAVAGQSGFTWFMVIGLVGALLTAAYMTRCVYLTFFGEYRGHGHPHESPKAITVPLIILAAFSTIAGLANASAFGIEKFKEYVEPHGPWFPHVVQPDFDIGLAAISFAIVVVAIGIGLFFWLDRKELRGLKGLTARSGAAKAGHGFLVNKYY